MIRERLLERSFDSQDAALHRASGCGEPVTRPWRELVVDPALDDPSAVSPDVHIFTRSKLPWVTLPDSVPAFKVYYDTNKLWPASSLERLEAVMAPSRRSA